MKSKFKHIFRVAVCLVLVCCLTVNISPIKAHASAFAAVVYPLSAASVTLSIMIGCGILPGTDYNVFSDVNATIRKNLQAAGWITDGYIDVYKLNDAAYTWGVPVGIIDAVRASLRDNEYYDYEITSANYLPAGTYVRTLNKSGTEISGTLTSDQYAFYLYYNSKLYLVFCGLSSSCINYNDSTTDVGTGSYFWNTNPQTKWFYTSCYDVPLSYNPAVTFVYFTDSNTYDEFEDAVAACFRGQVDGAQYNYYSTYDLSMGKLAPDTATFADGYSEWASNAVTVPGTAGDGSDDVVVVPVGDPTLSDVTTQSQEDIWNGTLSDPEVDDDKDVVVTPDIGTGSDTITGADGLTGTLADTNADTFLGALGDYFTSWFQNILAWLSSLWTAITEGFLNLMTITDTISTSITSFGESIVEKLTSVWTTIKEGFMDVINGTKTLPEAIAQAIAAIFVPSTDYITAKVEAIRAMFPFMDSIIATGEYIRDSLSGASGPPAIYVDLSAADGDIDYGDRVLLTDFSWYAPYKGTVDTVLGAALWAFFGWRVFLRLPGLISGADGYVGEIRSLSSRSSGSGEKRKKE